jgi:hypothetical protein
MRRMRRWFLPVAALGLALAGTAAADDVLPLKRGRYAPVGGPCSADVVLIFDGDTLGRPGLRRCRATANKTGSMTYKLTEICHGDAGDVTQETTYRLTSRSSFQMLDRATGPGPEYHLCAPPAEPETIRGFTP